MQLAVLLYCVVAWTATSAVFLLALEHWAWDLAPSLAVALIGWIPLIGHLVAVHAAMQVWDWSSWLSALVFLLSVPLAAITAEWRHQQRARTRLTVGSMARQSASQ